MSNTIFPLLLQLVQGRLWEMVPNEGSDGVIYHSPRTSPCEGDVTGISSGTAGGRWTSGCPPDESRIKTGTRESGHRLTR